MKTWDVLGHKQDLNTGPHKRTKKPERGKSDQESVACGVQVPSEEEQWSGFAVGSSRTTSPPPVRSEGQSRTAFPGLSLLARSRSSSPSAPPPRPIQLRARRSTHNTASSAWASADSGKPPGGEAWRCWSRRSRDRPASGSLSAQTPRAPTGAPWPSTRAPRDTRAALSWCGRARTRLGRRRRWRRRRGLRASPPGPSAAASPPARPGPRPRPPASRRRFRLVLPLLFRRRASAAGAARALCLDALGAHLGLSPAPSGPAGALELAGGGDGVGIPGPHRPRELLLPRAPLSAKAAGSSV